MKKYVLVFLLLLGVSQVETYAQKKLTVAEDPAVAAKLHDAPGENEAVVILASPFKLTFDSTMDKKANINPKEEKEGDTWVYYLKLPTTSRYNGRKLKIESSVYETYTYPLALKSGDVLGLAVSDPFAKEFSKLELLRDEGDALFNKCDYTEAVSKYKEGLSSFNAELDTAEDKENITGRLNKAQACMNAKAAADNYYNSEKWSLAYNEYSKIIGLNIADTYSKERLNICRMKRIDEPRVLTGIVRDNTGATVAGATVIPGIDGAAKGGKTDYPQRLAVKTDASGRFRINTTYRTTKLKCWYETTSFGAMEVDVFNDVVNIALRTGGNARTTTNSSSSEGTKSNLSSDSNKSSSNTQSSSSSKPKRTSTIKPVKPK